MTRIDNRVLSARLRASIGRQALAARRQQGLTQAEVAERMGKATDFYGRIERGESLPGVETLRQLSLALGVSVDRLIDSENLGDASGFPEPPAEVRAIVDEIGDDRELLELVDSLLRAAEDTLRARSA